MELTLEQALQKGVEAHKAGKAQEADRYYTAILKANPKHPDANHNMGVLAVGLGKAEAALPFLKAALEANPKAAQFWLSYINALITLNRLDDARAVFDQAKSTGAKGEGFDQIESRLGSVTIIEGDQANEAILQKAIELRENGKYDEAIDLLKNRIDKFPEDPNLPAILSHCFILNDNLKDAVIYLEKAKNLDPKIASVGWNETRLLLKQMKQDEALKVAEKTNKLFPNDVEGIGVLGICLRATGNLDESLKYLNKAVELNPNYAEAIINRALINIAKEDKVRALSDLETAHHLKPHLKQIWDLLIGLIVETKNYSKAIDLLIKMIEVDPSHEKSFSLLTACNQEADDPTLAIKSFEQLLKFKPNDATNYFNLGIALKRQGKNEKAIEHFEKALAIKPDFSEAYYNMGAALQEQDRLEKAIEAFNKAIIIKPDYAEAYNNMGVALTDQIKLKDSIVAFKKAIELKPEFVQAHNNMGITLQELNKLDESKEAYKKAISIKPDYANAYNNLTGLLKMYSPKKESSHILFETDDKIKKLSSKLLNSSKSVEITNNVIEGLAYLEEDSYAYKTPLSQIYKRGGGTDLNCKRHLKIFDKTDIIPEFCFGCFKVQVEVDTFIELIKLTSLFYKFDFKEDLSRKTMVELRPNISGFYKGLIYCRGLDQAQAVKSLLDIHLKDVFENKITSKIKRGCSEYPLKHPDYGKISKRPKDMMSFPKEWKILEEEFDQNNLIKPNENPKKSLPKYCLSDFYIIQKWIDYAKGLDDHSVLEFNNRPIVFAEIYEMAKERKESSINN